jgi:hypothetical protein
LLVIVSFVMPALVELPYIVAGLLRVGDQAGTAR